MYTDKKLFPSGEVGFEGLESRRNCGDTFEDVVQRRLDRRHRPDV